MRLSFALPLLAIAPAAMSQDISSLIASVTGSLGINLSSLTSDINISALTSDINLSSLEASASSYYSAHSNEINSLYSSLSANPSALSSLASEFSTTFPMPTSTGSSGGSGGGSGSGSGGGNAGLSLQVPSTALSVMGAAAVGVFGLAVAL